MSARLRIKFVAPPRGTPPPEAVQRELERIELERLPGLDEIEVAVSHATLTVVVWMSFTEHNTGERKRFFHPHSVPLREHVDADAPRLAAVVREAIRRAYEHEIEESILVDGRRVFDPHRLRR